MGRFDDIPPSSGKGIDLGSPLATLHRYFIVANKMRIRFENTLAKPEILKRLEDAESMDAESLTKLVLELHLDDYGVFMYYWYSALYVVIEGFKELRLRDAKIEALLQSQNVDALKRLRNATFHFQKEFISRKIFPFLASKDSTEWIRSLTGAFSEFFLREPKF
jgi:hypothetical protein